MIESVIISGVSIFIFVLGICVHKYCINIYHNTHISKPTSFINKHHKKQNIEEITLDETKVVLKIDTNGLEKKSEVLASTIVAENDTVSAIDKLKNMKGR